MGNKSAKLKPEGTTAGPRKTFVEHPLTTAILQKDLPLFEDLMNEHLDSIENIEVSFPNEEEW